MKNIYSAAVAFALLLGAGSCDYNDQFDGLEELVKPSDVRAITYTLTEDDYSSFSGLSGSYFSESTPAQDYMPSFLDAMLPTVDNGSSVKVTYNYMDGVPAYLSDLSGAGDYTVSSSDYTSVWGAISASYFTPERPLSGYASKFLAAAYPDATSGEVVVVEYNYSASEPSASGDSSYSVTEIYEDFNTIATAGATTEIMGWINYAEEGGIYWVDKLYSGNGYIQCSAYGATGDVATWLISPLVDFTDVTSAQFSFDVCLGYANGAELQILISEDFNGDESGCSTATWVDVTSNFAFEIPSSSYGTLSPSGLMDMSDYVGKKFYVAFKYVGSSTLTTTFQIDNIELGESSTVAENITLSQSFVSSEDDWTLESVSGTLAWSQASYGSDSYMKASAYGYSGTQEAFLISPAITVADGARFSFDVLAGYYNATCLSVLISTDYVDSAASATWTDVSSSLAIPDYPTSGYGSFESSGIMLLSDYEGQTIRIAFKYTGDGDNSATTTYEVTNVVVLALERVAAKSASATRAIDGVHTLEAVYTYNGSAWVAYSDALSISSDNYAEMGLTTFSSSATPASYIPTWLKEQRPYAVEADVVAVVYDYYTSRYAAEYTYTGGAWVENNGVVEVTDQFVKSNDEWAFDPSTVITLDSDYYQAAVDWVWANVDQAQLGATSYGQGYVSSYGTNEYYTGCSAYYNNVDMRTSSAYSQYPDGYSGLSDDEITALMTEHLIEVMAHVLASKHSDATTVDGIDVIYTLNFTLYNGSSYSYTMQYEVVGNGVFEYVEDSFQAL
ncbi:MAG: choice-of-anchor J domain-containing protein [Rikenellaceae bacterium]